MFVFDCIWSASLNIFQRNRKLPPRLYRTIPAQKTSYPPAGMARPQPRGSSMMP